MVHRFVLPQLTVHLISWFFTWFRIYFRKILILYLYFILRQIPSFDNNIKTLKNISSLASNTNSCHWIIALGFIKSGTASTDMNFLFAIVNNITIFTIWEWANIKLNIVQITHRKKSFRASSKSYRSIFRLYNNNVTIVESSKIFEFNI